MNVFTLFRRILTVIFWPFIDIVMTVFGNFMLLAYGVGTAVVTTSALAILLNLMFLELLFAEKGVPYWFEEQFKKIEPLYQKILKFKRGKTLAVFLVYIFSGPAMAGAPLVWLLKIRRKIAYPLVVVSLIVNSIIWTAGVYNTFWVLAGRILK